MTKFTTPQGRVIHLERLSVALTYNGHLEGSPETITKRYLERTTRFSHDKNGLPVFTIIPDVFPWPSWTCQAEFGSDRGVKTNDSDFRSRLAVRWLTDETAFDQSVNDLIKSILPLFDWEEYAEDWDITFI